jgi:hypothetical protein
MRYVLLLFIFIFSIEGCFCQENYITLKNSIENAPKKIYEGKTIKIVNKDGKPVTGVLIIIDDWTLSVGSDTINICSIKEIGIKPKITRIVGLTLVGVSAVILTGSVVAIIYGGYGIISGLIRNGTSLNLPYTILFFSLLSIPPILTIAGIAGGGILIYEYESTYEIINCEIKITKNYSNSKVIDK